MDIGAWWATVHRVTKKQTRLKLSLCLSFCSKMRAQTGAETQVVSGCPELPVRCCLQLENQWLWDRGSAPRSPQALYRILCPGHVLIHTLDLPGSTP